jgi:hypothetical protein
LKEETTKRKRKKEREERESTKHTQHIDAKKRERKKCVECTQNILQSFFNPSFSLFSSSLHIHTPSHTPFHSYSHLRQENVVAFVSFFFFMWCCESLQMAVVWCGEIFLSPSPLSLFFHFHSHT